MSAAMDRGIRIRYILGYTCLAGLRQREGAIEIDYRAASIFLACGVGISVGLEQWIIAIETTILAMLVLRVVLFRSFQKF